jgi:hypothetical protein
MFAKIEEVAEIELLDAVLYSYRLSGRRTSHELGTSAAEDMWRRLAVNAVQRRGIPLELANAVQPFTFSATPSARPDAEDCDLLILSDGFAIGSTGQIDPREKWSLSNGIAPDRVHVLSQAKDISRAIASALAGSDRNYVCLMRQQPSGDCRQAIELLLREMDSNEADLAGPKVLDCSGRIVSADPYFDSELMPASAGWLEQDQGRFDYISHASWLPAAMLLVRRHVFRSIGSLDPDLAGDLRDADFSLRARSRGFKCLYAGNVAMYVPTAGDAPARAGSSTFRSRWSRSPELLFPEQLIPQ